MYHKELFGLLNNLSENENQELTFLLKSRKKQNTYTKKLILYLLSQDTIPSNKQVYKKLYKGGEPFSDEAFERLILRATSEAFEVLNNFIQRDTSEFDEIDNTKIKIHQQAATLQFLKAKRSQNKLVDNLRNEIIQSAIEFEYYAILIDQLTHKKFELALREGKKSFFELQKSISHYEKCDKAVKNANNLFYILKFESLQTTFHEKKKYESLLKKHIIILLKEFKITNSPTVKYYLFQHQLSLLYLNENYKKAKPKCLEMLALVQESQSIKRKVRVGVIYDNLVKCEIYLQSYEQAIIWSKYAQLESEDFSRNYWISLEQEFLSNFYLNNMTRAEEIINRIFLEQKKAHRSFFERDTLKFYKAMLLVKKGEFEGALTIFKGRGEISKDLVGWDFWSRVMKIYVNLLLGREEKASPAVVSLKKQMQRIKKHKSFRQRDQVIFNIIMELYRKGFSPYEVNPKANLQLCKLEEIENQWKPFSAELIPFEELLKMRFKKLFASQQLTG